MSPDGLAESSRLRAQQLLFANHLRNPQQFAAPPGISERRLRIYRDLFFNNISNLLAGAFPVIRSILADDVWQALVRDFYTQHRCETPLFPFIAGEFADYLADEHTTAGDLPFLAELAHYEWVEIALRHSDAVLPAAGKTGKPQLSPLCWPLLFRWPVHRLGADYQPAESPPEPTYLLVYRHADEMIRFVASNAATFRLLQLLEDAAVPDVRTASQQLAHELQHPDPLALQDMAEQTVRDLLTAGVLYLS